MKKSQKIWRSFAASTILAAGFVWWPAMAVAQEAKADDTSDIIVTATLRSENLQDVPVAVSAFDASRLEKAGVTDIRGLERASASFNLQSGPTATGSTTLRVRGVGTTGNNTGLESSVGIFLDGVYLSRPGIALGELLDLEQVELMRGPQGTLFGRNTSAGALSIRTRKPSIDKTEGFANATYGNYNLMNLQAGISTPLSETTAVRLSAAWRDRDGFLRNANGGDSHDRNRYLVRGQFYFEPNDGFDLRLIADYSKAKEHCCDGIIIRDTAYVNGPYALNGLPANGGVAYSGVEALKHGRTSNDGQPKDYLEQWGTSAEANIAVGDAKLTLITAYRHSLAEPTTEPDFVSLKIFSLSDTSTAATRNSGHAYTRLNSFTQEARLAGTALGDKLDYLIGAFYANEKISEIQSGTIGADYQPYISAVFSSLGVPGSNIARIFAGGVSAEGAYAVNAFSQSGRNWSVFTNNTFHLTDAFGLNVGLRYSDDRKHGTYDQVAASNPACVGVVNNRANIPAPLQAAAIGLTCLFNSSPVGLHPGSPVEYDKIFKDNELIYTAKLLAKLNEDSNAYASFSHGYKAGGLNLDPTAAAAGGDPRFKSEGVDAIELGLKSRLFNRRLTANVALFSQKLKNFQVLEFTGLQFKTFNVDKARSSGVEVELNGRVSSEFSLNSAITYTDAHYPKDCGGTSPSATVAMLCGQQLTSAPKWVVIGGFDWEHELVSGHKIIAAASGRYTSARRTTTQALQAVFPGTGTEGPSLEFIKSPFDIQKGDLKIDLRLGVEGKDSRWAIEFWGTNITDQRTQAITANTPARGISNLPGPFNAGGIGLSRVTFPDEPRTYGVTVRTKF